jgi:hypothetical protein
MMDPDTIKTISTNLSLVEAIACSAQPSPWKGATLRPPKTTLDWRQSHTKRLEIREIYVQPCSSSEISPRSVEN